MGTLEQRPPPVTRGAGTALDRRVRPVAVLVWVLVALAGSSCRLIEVPSDDEIKLPTLAQTSILYDDRGQVIRRFYDVENRVLIPIDEVPVVVRDAVLAIEDQRFYHHHGVDLRALVRAAYNNAKSGRIVQGGSTITEQLVKNTITGGERTLDRKVREAIIAYQLEERHSKDWILEQYLNTVYFGRGAYGIQAAARTYFARPASKLTLGQGAFLAGLIRSPATYDPDIDTEAAVARRNQVLANMSRLDMITEDEYRLAIDNPLGLRPGPGDRYQAPYFVQEVVEWFVSQERFGPNRDARFDYLYQGGLRIYTTVDLAMQQLADAAVKTVLTERSDPYGSMAVLDPRDGAVKAMVGGRDFFATEEEEPFKDVNLATFRGGTRRQAGSSFKPFALVAALENGISPQQTYPAPPEIEIELPPDCQGEEPTWNVRNYEGSAAGNPTVEGATVASLNVVYAQIVQDLGRGNPCDGGEKVVEAASRMGITSALTPNPAATLGTNAVHPLEMASAYGTLATVGRHVEPMLVTRITDAAGSLVYEAEPTPEQVLNPGIAWTALEMLEKVVQHGTGTAADIGRPQAGKTGTAQQWRDAWFVGFIPQLVTAVWVGFPEGEIEMVYPRTRLYHVTGGSWPAMIWREFMSKATAGMPVLDFVEPDVDYVSVAVDITRGCLPSEFTLPENIRVVQYVKGTEPTEKCDDDAREVAVPSVVGFDESDAVALLQDYGFQAAVERRETKDHPAGTVISQSPSAGSLAMQGTTVTIVVAKKPEQDPGPPPGEDRVEVPAVVGMQRDDAVATLQDAGFAVSVVERWECRPPDSCGAVPGQVWSQDPPGGRRAEPGSTVTIWANKESGGGGGGDGGEDMEAAGIPRRSIVLRA